MLPRIPIALVLVFILLIGATPVFAQETAPDTAFIPSDLYDSKELLNNTELELPVECGISGDSGEFSYLQNQDAGMVILSWTHVAGTVIEYNLTDSSFPHSLEYAYFYEEFSWNHDVTPTSANLSIVYNITTTGDFQNDFWPGMYEIWTWLVHPNGNWFRIENFYGGNDETFSQWIIMGNWVTDEVFQGLIEAGPMATSKLVIGLVPSRLFLSNFDSDPWREYNGSVLISFQKLNMNVFYRTENDFPTAGEPLYERSWRQGDSDRYRSSCITPEGYTYLLSMYDDDNLGHGTSLTKLDSRAEVVWRKTWNDTDTVFWYDVACYSNMVYLVGPTNDPRGGSNLFLMALDWNGDSIWSKEYDYDYSDYPRAIEINDDGEIFIGFSSSDGQYYETNRLIKLDLEGLEIWEEEFGVYEWDDIIDMSSSKEGYIYTLTYFQLIQWNKDGEKQWDIQDYTTEMCVLSDSSVLAVQSFYTGRLNLTKFNSEGVKEWSQMIALRYTEDWYDYAQIRSMTQSPDGTIYLLLAMGGFHPGRVIIRMNQDGIQLENYTVAFSEELYMAYNVPQYMDIHISSNNIVYLCGRMLDDEWDYSVTVAVHGIEPLFFGSFGGTLLSTGIATTAIISTIVVWHFLQKNKK